MCYTSYKLFSKTGSTSFFVRDSEELKKTMIL